MGKKKNQTPQTPTEWKDAGNKSFAQGQFKEAVECYTKAIESAEETKSDVDKAHVFYANRANAYLSLNQYENCIEDSTTAIILDQTYAKAYLRRACALWEMHTVHEDALEGALKDAQEGYKLDETNEELKLVMQRLEMENAREYATVKKDHPVRQCWRDLTGMIKQMGGKWQCQLDWLDSETNRGLRASHRVSQGNAIVKLPYQCVIKQDMMIKDEWVKQLLESKIFKGGKELVQKLGALWTVWCLKMIKQGEECPFRKYFDLWPTKTDNFPIFFTKETLAILEPSSILEALELKQLSVKMDYETICQVIPEFKTQFDMIQYMHVYSLVTSRWQAMQSLNEEGEKVTTLNLIPLLEMANHRCPATATWVAGEEGLEIVALEDINRGDPIYFNYGAQLSNRDFFLHYGFVCNKDPTAWAIQAPLKLIEEFPLYEKKKALLDEKYHEQTFVLRPNLLEESIYYYLSFARFLVFDDESELEAYCYVAKTRVNPPGSDFKGYFDPVSNRNESLAWVYVDQFARAALEVYEEKKDQPTVDLYFADRSKVPLPSQMCLQYLMNEKKVLYFLADTAQKALKVLKMNKKDALKEINSWPMSEMIIDYFRKNLANQLLEDGDAKETAPAAQVKEQ